jgi:hypothetical protein
VAIRRFIMRSIAWWAGGPAGLGKQRKPSTLM